MKSIPHFAKGPMETTGCKGAGCDLILLLYVWQAWNFWTAVIQSLNKEGQKYPAHKIFWAVAYPDM
jgi:hypothetical protein